MLQRVAGRGGWFLEVGLAVVWATAAGCAGDDGAGPVARNRIVGRAVELPRTMRSLSLPPDTNSAPDTGLRQVDEVTVDARVLVITADGTDSSADAITETLRYLGTPFDVLNATTGPTLTPEYLAVDNHGRYYGVVLDVGDLVAGNLSAFSDEEWMTLASYEARFGVRRAVMYAFPTDAYGLTSTGSGFDVSTTTDRRALYGRGRRRVRGRELRRLRSPSMKGGPTAVRRPMRRRCRCWSTTRAPCTPRRAPTRMDGRRWC